MKKSERRAMVLWLAIWAILGVAFTYASIEEVNAEAFVIAESGAETVLSSLGTYTITAYCPCKKCCGKTDGITASGTKATAGRTIAAPKGFAFGTKLVIDGVEYTVEDRGGSVKGKRLDIFFNSHSEAKKYGKQRREVFSYE